MSLLLLLLACPPQDRAWPGPALDTGGGAPAVAFTFPEEGAVRAEGDSLSLQARVEDDSPISALELEVLEDGEPVTPAVSGDGVISWTTTVLAGEHSATVIATDPQGLHGSAQRTWSGAALPELSILAPADGAKLDSGAAWQLQLHLADEDGGDWTVSALVDGGKAAQEQVQGSSPLDQDLVLDMPPLGTGEHQVEARIEDGTGSASARLTLYGT